MCLSPLINQMHRQCLTFTKVLPPPNLQIPEGIPTYPNKSQTYSYNSRVSEGNLGFGILTKYTLVKQLQGVGLEPPILPTMEMQKTTLTSEVRYVTICSDAKMVAKSEMSLCVEVGNGQNANSCRD